MVNYVFLIFVLMILWCRDFEARLIFDIALRAKFEIKTTLESISC
jgi:hypothetical protein